MEIPSQPQSDNPPTPISPELAKMIVDGLQAHADSAKREKEKPKPNPSAPEKNKAPDLMNDFKQWGKLFAGGILAVILGLAIGITLVIGIPGLAALGLVLVVGIGLGFLVGFMQNPWNWCQVQRMILKKNVGIAVVITKARMHKPFICDWNKDYAEIANSGVYWLSSNKVSPMIWGGVPTLFFYQGISDPIPYEDAVKDLRDDASFNNALMMKERAIAQANAILQFKDELLKIIKQNFYVCVIGFILVVIGIIVLYATINSVGTVDNQNLYLLKECLNQTGIKLPVS